jgi:hypothetical protein
MMIEPLATTSPIKPSEDRDLARAQCWLPHQSVSGLSPQFVRRSKGTRCAGSAAGDPIVIPNYVPEMRESVAVVAQTRDPP